MSPDEHDHDLKAAAMGGNFSAVETALAAGASVNGYPEQSYAPIVAATILKHAGIVNLLLEHGADPDRPVTRATQVPCPSYEVCTIAPGERALHIAATAGEVEIVSLLLKWSGADLNATDNTGCTPLLAACRCPPVYVEVVRLLLEAGADPTLAQAEGIIPLQAVAVGGHIDLVDMLYSRAPYTLNQYSYCGATPLFLACYGGHASMVSKLLSLGAMQPMPLNVIRLCPLLEATMKGFVDVVRVLINEGGRRAVGGKMPLAQALSVAVTRRRARILRLLLTAVEKERRSEWANTNNRNGRRLLHCGAGYCCPAEVSILLEAGADEAARDSEGCIPLDVIGVDVDRDDEVEKDPGKELAIRRMLQRGPAYRARSWDWPSDEGADAGGSGDGDTAAAAAVLSSPPAIKTPPVIDVRIFRPNDKSSGKFFGRLIGRYCAKE